MSCKKCNSLNISEQVKSFEDLHNILKIFICLDCGNKDTKLINIQNGDENGETKDIREKTRFC